ncbi:MAG: DUF5074 domain-containing protein [Bacteroidota bacterium]
MNKNIYLFFLAVIFLFSSCKKDKPKKLDNSISTFANGVFILNEGNYTWNNASVSFYDFKTNTLTDDVFKQANEFSLGDVAQSISKINNSYFIVVNNSKKIEIVDALTFKKTATLTGFKSPRYCALVGVNKVYVTDLYDNAISVVNLIDAKIDKKIYCKGWTEQLLQYKNNVYVTNLNSTYLYVIDALKDELKDSIAIGYGSNSLCLDSNNKLWITCNGNTSLGLKPSVKKINPETNQVELTFETENGANNICTNATKDTIYFLSKDVFQFEKNSASLPSAPLIKADNLNFYALGIKPLTGDVFVSDAIDYVQQGTILRYDNKGNKLAEFKAGIIPNGFLFK